MIRLARRTILAWIAALPLGLAAKAGAETQAAETASDVPPGEQRWLCTFNECDPYVYDPLKGDPDNIAGDHPLPPGIAFEDLPDDWLCPVCGSPKSYFVKTDRHYVPLEE